METQKSVGIWIRVSTDFQVKDDSPEHHEKRARMYAESKGWNVAEVYRLEAISGKAVIDLPEARKMLKDIREKRITGLIFSKLARLARNTKELLEFAEIFRSCNADLISLSESIDTSSPAGRLFYTMIAAMAEWERQEIAERVSASVPVRAKMGKPLGGQAPFGYSWDSKELVINEDEAPVRRLIYELFQECKRKKKVATILNERGYRTRNGSKFSSTTISRLLRDPMAKGERRANYTKSLGEGKRWIEKPPSEWVYISCPPIVDADLWDECNRILDSQETTRPISRTTVHIFSGVLKCACGGKMYVPSRVKKYVCQSCKSISIGIDDIESIYYEQLKSFLLTKEDMETYLMRASEAITSKQSELENLIKESNRVKHDMDNIMKIYLAKQIEPEAFGGYFNPLNIQYKQLESSILETTGQLDFLKVQHLNSDLVLAHSESLYDKWPTLDHSGKRSIVQELTESITIGTEDVSIIFLYSPQSLGKTPTSEHMGRGSYWRPT